MAKISIGPSMGNSSLSLEMSLAHASQFEIDVGEGRDMSTRQITLLERDAPAIERELAELQQHVESAVVTEPITPAHQVLKADADKFAAAASETVKQRKWMPISITDLLKSAAAVGVAAAPVVESVTKIIGLLRQIYA